MHTLFNKRKYSTCLRFWIFVESTNYKWQILFCVIFPLIDKAFTFQCTLHKNGTIWFAYKQVLIANECDGRCDIMIKFVFNFIINYYISFWQPSREHKKGIYKGTNRTMNFPSSELIWRKTLNLQIPVRIWSMYTMYVLCIISFSRESVIYMKPNKNLWAYNDFKIYVGKLQILTKTRTALFIVNIYYFVISGTNKDRI